MENPTGKRLTSAELKELGTLQGLETKLMQEAEKKAFLARLLAEKKATTLEVALMEKELDISKSYKIGEDNELIEVTEDEKQDEKEDKKA